ncbi:MAG: sortase [Oscillospiraceae bacterium]|nr:sortase [Oscillospiraceae bacterium]
MSDKNNNEKEYTVDDILAEFDDKVQTFDEPDGSDETASVSEEEPAADGAPAESKDDTAALKEELAELRAELAVIKEELASYKKEAAMTETEAVTSDKNVVNEEISFDAESLDDSPEESFDPDSEYEAPPVEPIIKVAPIASFKDTEVKAEAPFAMTEEQAVDGVLNEKPSADEQADTTDEPTLQDEINEIISDIWEPSAEVVTDTAETDEAAFSEELGEELVTEEEAAAQIETEDNEVIIEDAEEAEPAIPLEKTEKSIEKAEAPEEIKEEGEAMPENNTPVQENEKKSFLQGIIPWKGDSVFEVIRKIIFIAAVAVFIGAGIMLITTLGDSHTAVEDAGKNEEIIATTVATTINSDGEVVTVAPTEDEIIEHNIDVMQKYKEISENVIGYIELSGCDLFQPIVQGEDNDYYLTHTYYDEKNKGGSIFADYRCRIEEDYTSPNLVLYGHNQEDGTMFGNLKNYKQNLEFYAENPVVTIGTEYGVKKYLIYGFFVTNALENQDTYGEVFHYHDYIEVMNDEYTFNWYMGEVEERNQIISPVDVQFGDELLCLSTCSNEFSNSRFVVFARKLRDGESPEDYDYTKAYFNPNARGVDWSAILSGETSEESVLELTVETVSETEETAEETTVVPETQIIKTKKTEETSKTKRVDRTKTSYSHTISTKSETQTDPVQLTDENGSVITAPPLTDESGNPLTDENGNTFTAEIVTDESGAVVTDENGGYVTAPPVTDEDGNIVTTVPVTDENGETVTCVPAAVNEEMSTETAGLTQ